METGAVNREAITNLELPKLKVTTNVNKFRKPALMYEKHQVYTFAPRGTSEYLKYWTQEFEYCIEGYTAEDGDRIPGYMYFYLNYYPIDLVKEVEVEVNGEIQMRAETSRDFPRFYDYDRWFFEAVEYAELVGRHMSVVKSRRKGYSYKVSAMLVRNYYFIKESKGFAIAAEAEYLVRDGILSKAWDGMNFIDQHTAWSKRRQKTNTKMHRRASYVTKNEAGAEIEMGYKSEIMGISLKNDPDKARGKKGKLIVFEESGCHAEGTLVVMYDGSLKPVEEIKKGDVLLGPDSKPRTVKECHAGIGNMYTITPKNGIPQIVNSHHKIPIEYYEHQTKKQKYLEMTPEEYLKEVEGREYRKAYYSMYRPEGVDFQPEATTIDPYTLGLWLGDGDSTRFDIASNDKEVQNYLISMYGAKSRSIKGTTCKTLKLGDKKPLEELGLINNKHIPKNYKINSREVRLGILAGLIDSDGTYDSKKKAFQFTQHDKRKHIVDDFEFICRSLGMKTSRDTRVSKERNIAGKTIKGGEVNHRVTILYGHEQIPTKIKRKQSTDRSGFLRKPLNTRFDIEFAGAGKYYGFSLKEDPLYLVEDFTVSHNSFPNLLHAWQVSKPSVEQGSFVFGTMIAFGTGGDMGEGLESLKELFERPKAYGCLQFDNVWDEEAYGQKCGFFIPQYANMEGKYQNDDDPNDPWNGIPFMDEDGNTNIPVAKKYILLQRMNVIKNSSDRRAIDRHTAEQPVTPAEALMDFSANIFPKVDLQKHLANIRNNKQVEHFKQVGDLTFNEAGNVTWNPVPVEEHTDIIKYRLDPNDRREGRVVIWEHPKQDPPWGLYIAGCDPYDHDSSGTDSLGSIFIYKRFREFDKYYELPVAEYTGRPNTSTEFYENVRKLLLYYNATLLYENEKKGLFFYFERMNCTHLLADQPNELIGDIVKDSSVARKKGIHMNKHIKSWGEIAIRDWLVEEYAPGKKNLTKILSPALLEELIFYNDTGNFDRVMAFMVTLMYREQLHKVVVRDRKRTNRINKQLFTTDIFSNNSNEDHLVRSAMDVVPANGTVNKSLFGGQTNTKGIFN